MFSSVFSTSKQQQERKEKPTVHWNELAIDDVVRCVCIRFIFLLNAFYCMVVVFI